MVFQDCALYPHMTVRENLNFGLRVRRVSGADAVRRIGDIAARLEISDWLDRWPEELSGGQKHRVALGRALVRQPRVLLLDEPLAGLDEPSRLKLRREIQRLHAENHFTMIYVTHDQAEAMALGERIILLENGRVQQSGKPVELFERPANRFVASFFGAPPMNFLPGEYRSAGGQCSFSVASANGSFGSTSAAPASDGEIVLPLTHGPLDHLPGTSGPIWCGFRPEDLTMANAPTQMSSEKVWILPCRVIAVERIGRVNWVHGSCGGHPLVALWEGGMIAAPGEELTLNLEISKANWFEVATGARLCG